MTTMSPWEGNIGPFLHAHDSQPRTAAAESYFFATVRVITTRLAPFQSIIA
jgi:hypothetical protein